MVGDSAVPMYPPPTLSTLQPMLTHSTTTLPSGRTHWMPAFMSNLMVHLNSPRRDLAPGSMQSMNVGLCTETSSIRICLFVCLFVCLFFVFLFVWGFFVWFFVCLFGFCLFEFVYFLFVCLFVCFCFFVSLLFVYLFLCLFLCLFVYLFVLLIDLLIY